MEFCDIDVDIQLLILVIHNCVLISSQLVNRNIRAITKEKFVYQISITNEEINNYIDSQPNKYKINYGCFNRTHLNPHRFHSSMDIYMYNNNKITFNPIFRNKCGPVGPCSIKNKKFNFEKTKSNFIKTYKPNSKCEMDFISQCKIYSKRFDNYKCILLKVKILQLLYNIVYNFKMYNDVSYSYLIHDFDLFGIADNRLITSEFIMQDICTIVNYLYEKLSEIIKID